LAMCADFYERYWLQQKEASSVAKHLRDRLMHDAPSPARQLAAMRLNVRIGGTNNAPNFRVPTIANRLSADDERWLAQLQEFRDIDAEREAILAGSIATTQRQLVILRTVCESSSGEFDAQVREICSNLLRDSRPAKEFPLSRNLENDDAYAVVRLHLLRPSTPQWYVAFAAALRRTKKTSIRLSDFIDLTFANSFDVHLPANVRNTKLVADVFGELDQLGLLLIVLENSARQNRGDMRALLEDYKQWRTDLIRVDEWFEPRLRAFFKRRGQQ
jgi:hypothetical protein